MPVADKLIFRCTDGEGDRATMSVWLDDAPDPETWDASIAGLLDAVNAMCGAQVLPTILIRGTALAGGTNSEAFSNIEDKIRLKCVTDEGTYHYMEISAPVESVTAVDIWEDDDETLDLAHPNVASLSTELASWAADNAGRPITGIVEGKRVRRKTRR